MKFTIMSGDLAAAVGWVSHALPRRAAVPVLAGILVEVDDDGAVFSALDYDTSRRIVVELDAPVDAGRVLLPGRVLAEVAKGLPKNELVDVAVDEQEAVIRCGRSEYGLPLMPVGDYPNLPKHPAVVGSIDSKSLAQAVAQVVIAAGKDDSLPMLGGARIEVDDDGTLNLATTDRYRLAWRTVSWSPTIDDPADVHAMIPAKILSDVARGLPDGDVHLAIGNGLACFTTEGRAVTVRLLDDQFVDFRSFFEKAKSTVTAVVDPGHLAKAVKRVALMAEQNTPVRLDFAATEVMVEAGGSDIGRACEPVGCELSGDPIKIAFHPGKLVDALASFSGPVEMRMSAHDKPCLFGQTGDESHRHLVMPIRLS